MSKVTKKERQSGIITAISRTEEEKVRRTIKRMSRMYAAHRTFVGKGFIQRNDPCYCGSEKKFKDCCWHKHAAKQSQGTTSETLNYINKQDKYFDKKMGRNKDVK